MGQVEGFTEEYWNGCRYFKGERGTIALPHPTDPRISRSINIGKAPPSTYQMDLQDFQNNRRR